MSIQFNVYQFFTETLPAQYANAGSLTISTGTFCVALTAEAAFHSLADLYKIRSNKKIQNATDFKAESNYGKGTLRKYAHLKEKLSGDLAYTFVYGLCAANAFPLAPFAATIFAIGYSIYQGMYRKSEKAELSRLQDENLKLAQSKISDNMAKDVFGNPQSPHPIAKASQDQRYDEVKKYLEKKGIDNGNEIFVNNLLFYINKSLEIADPSQRTAKFKDGILNQIRENDKKIQTLQESIAVSKRFVITTVLGDILVRGATLIWDIASKVLQKLADLELAKHPAWKVVGGLTVVTIVTRVVLPFFGFQIF